MKNLSIGLRGAFALVCAGFLNARDIGTPLPLQYAPHYLYGIYRPYDRTEECPWYVTVGGGAYSRSASDAFQCGTCKEDYSALIFGKSSFRLAEAFENGTVGTDSDNPFVTLSTLTPRYEYNERGAMFWSYMGSSFGCEDEWKYGLRLRLPVRDIQIQEVCGSDLVGDTLSDVFERRIETINVEGTNFTNTVFAARLDFLSSLNRVVFNSTGGFDPLVIYVNPADVNQITIADQRISGDQAAAQSPLDDNLPPVAAIASSNGALPQSVRWGDLNSTIAGVIQADGSGLSNNERGRFASDIQYAALGGDIAAQRKLFIVPTINNDGGSVGQPTNGANIIFGAIQSSVANSVIDFIQSASLNFCDGRNSNGLGDFDTELYLGRSWGCTDKWFTELQFGARFPTADRLCDCKQLIKPALGTGHYQVRAGVTAGVDATHWLRVKAEFKYNWALSRQENIAAPFKGATIKNIGPCIGADISWDYLLANLDFTLLASESCGLDIGYEGYHKRCDKIRLCAKTATDLIGRINQALDASVAMKGTNVTAHKIRTEAFLKTGCCDLFMGFDQVIAGSNTPRDTDLYIGMMVNF